MGLKFGLLIQFVDTLSLRFVSECFTDDIWSFEFNTRTCTYKFREEWNFCMGVQELVFI